MAAALGRLVAELDIDSSRFTEGIKRSSASADEFARSVGQTASGALSDLSDGLANIGSDATKAGASLKIASNSATGFEALNQTTARLSESVDALTKSVDSQTTGWRATASAVGAFATGTKSALDIFEKFGGVAPKWTKDFDAAKTKINEVSASVKTFTQNLLSHNEKAAATGPALQVVQAETAATAGGFRAAIPAVGGFVAALGPILIIGAAVAAVVIAVKAAISAAGDAVEGTVPGFGAARDVMEPMANALRDAAVAADEFAKKFGYTVIQASTFVEVGARLKVSASAGADGMQKLSDAMANTPETFTKFGIAVKDAEGKLRPLNDVANDAQKVLNTYATEVDKAGVANELFGGTAAQLSAAIKLSSPEYEKQNALLRQYGLLLGTDAVEAAERYTKAQNEFTYQAELTYRSLKTTIGGFFMPILTDMFELFTGGWPKATQAFRDGTVYIAEKLYALRAGILNFVDETLFAWEKLKIKISAGIDIASAAKNFDKAGIVAAYDLLQAQLATIDKSAIKQREAREIEYYDRIRKLRELGQGGGAAGTPGKNRYKPPIEDEEARAAIASINAIGKAIDDLFNKLENPDVDNEFRKQVELLTKAFQVNAISVEKYGLGLALAHAQSKTAKDGIKALADANKNYADSITAAYEAAINAIEAHEKKVEDLIKAVDAQNDSLRDELGALGLTDRERVKYNIELERTKALKNSMSDIQTAEINRLYDEKIALEETKASRLEYNKGYEQLSTSMTGFFEDLFLNGKKAFDNLWTSVKRFFANLAAQFATKFVLNAVLNIGGGGAGGIGSIIGSLLGGEGSTSGLGSIVSGLTSGLSSALGGTGFSGALGVFDSVLAGTGSVLEAATAGLSALTGGMTSFLGVLGPIGLALGAVAAVLSALGVFDNETGIKIDNSVTDGRGRKDIIRGAALGDFDVSGDIGNDAFKPLIDTVFKLDKFIAENLLTEGTLDTVRANIQRISSDATDWFGFEDNAGAKIAIEKASKLFLQQRYSVAFEEIDANVADMIRGFAGSADELLAYINKVAVASIAIKQINAAIPGLNISLSAFADLSETAQAAVLGLATSLESFNTDTNDTVSRLIEVNSRGVVSAYAAQADAILGLRGRLADGEISIEQFAQGVSTLATAYAQATSKIAETRNALAELFAGSQEGFLLSSLSNEDKYAYFQRQAEELFAALQNATDPEVIDRLARRIDAAQNSAFGLLDDAGRAAASPEFIAANRRVEDVVYARLEAAGDALDKQNADLKQIITDALAEFAADIQGTANQERETAQINADTARIPTRVEIVVKRNNEIEVNQ